VRLVILASKLQVPTCLTECAVELGRVMSVEVALEVLGSVPSEMDGCPEVRTLREKAREALIGAIEAKVEGLEAWRVFTVVGKLLEEKAFQISEHDDLERAVVGYLGPIHKLWDSGPFVGRSWAEGLSDKAKVGSRSRTEVFVPFRPGELLNTHLPRNATVAEGLQRGRLNALLRSLVRLCQTLSLPVLELALRSDDLQLASENDTFALVLGWVDSQPKTWRRSAFERLVRCLRFHHMCGSFLSVVGFCKYTHQSDHLMSACLRALAYQSIAASSRAKVKDQHPVAACKPSRAPAEPPLHAFEVQLELVQVLAIDKKLDIWLGLGSGFKISLGVSKVQKEGAAATLGLYVRLVGPEMFHLYAHRDETVGLVGPFVALRIRAGGKTRSMHHVYNDSFSSAHGYPDFFSKPWEQVVHGGSARFPEGRMTIKVEVLILSDKSAGATSLPAWARP
jgi:hypothetical protein